MSKSSHKQSFWEHKRRHGSFWSGKSQDAFTQQEEFELDPEGWMECEWVNWILFSFPFLQADSNKTRIDEANQRATKMLGSG